MLSVIEWLLLSLNEILPRSVSPQSEDPMSHCLAPFTKGRQRRDCYTNIQKGGSCLPIIHARATLGKSKHSHNIEILWGFYVQTHPVMNVWFL